MDSAQHTLLLDMTRDLGADQWPSGKSLQPIGRAGCHRTDHEVPSGPRLAKPMRRSAVIAITALLFALSVETLPGRAAPAHGVGYLQVLRLKRPGLNGAYEVRGEGRRFGSLMRRAGIPALIRLTAGGHDLAYLGRQLPVALALPRQRMGP